MNSDYRAACSSSQARFALTPATRSLNEPHYLSDATEDEMVVVSVSSGYKNHAARTVNPSSGGRAVSPWQNAPAQRD